MLNLSINMEEKLTKTAKKNCTLRTRDEED